MRENILVSQKVCFLVLSKASLEVLKKQVLRSKTGLEVPVYL